MRFLLCRRACLLAAVFCLTYLQTAYAQRIATGSRHSLIICADGTVWACGENASGQLGNGSQASSILPKQVIGLPNSVAMAVAAGDSHSLALLANGDVWAWGDNRHGQVGNGSSNSFEPLPVQVSGLNDIVAISTRYDHSLALKSNGTVFAWGNNSNGQLGDGTFSRRDSAVQVLALPSITAIAAGNYFSMALAADSVVWTWGGGGDGQLGNGSFDVFDSIPDPIAKDTIVKIAAGGIHALALGADGTIWAWGYDYYGQLGDGISATDQPLPVEVLNMTTSIDTIAAGADHSFAVLTNGNVRAWGRGTEGQLGNGGTSSPVPQTISALSSVSVLAGGAFHSLGLQTNGNVVVWGDNFYGQLGDNSLDQRTNPVPLLGLCPAYIDLRDTNFTNYFRPSAVGTGEWAAGELASSLPLPDGKHMYLFGQSHIGSISNGLIPCDPAVRVSNCIVIQDSAAPAQLTTLLNPNTLLSDRAYFRDTVDPTNHFRPGHGYLHDDSTVYIFLSKWSADSTFQGNYIGRLRKGITTWLLEDINRMNPGDSTIDFGCAILVDSMHVYAYGTKAESKIRHPYLARRLLNNTNANWEYYVGPNWSLDESLATSISGYNVGERFSVTKIQGQHYLISHDRDPDSTACGARRNVFAYRSVSLMGPYYNPQLLYVAEDTFGLGDNYLQTFSAYAHTELGNCDSLLMAYNVRDAGTCIDQCDGGGTLQLADTWRPQFIRIPLQAIDTQLQATPAPIASFTYNVNGSTVSFHNQSVNAAAYIWHFPNGDSSYMFEPIYQFTSSGIHTVTLIAIGCQGSRSTYSLQVGPVLGTDIHHPLATPKVSLFPNPNSGCFRLIGCSLGTKSVLVEIVSALGTTVYSQTHVPVGGKLELSLVREDLSPAVASGLFVVRLSNGRLTASTKFMISDK